MLNLTLLNGEAVSIDRAEVKAVEKRGTGATLLFDIVGGRGIGAGPCFSEVVVNAGVIIRGRTAGDALLPSPSPAASLPVASQVEAVS